MSFPVLLLIILLIFWVLGSASKGKQPKRTTTKKSKLKPVEMAVQRVGDDEITIEINWPATFLVIEKAVKIKDYDFARTWLQKFAYTTVDKEVPQAVRDRFKVLMTAFAAEDPLYRSLIKIIKPIVTIQPGILQTALYAQVPGYSTEQIRYALYFAHELGDLTRVKKGRSYQLYNP